MAGRQKKKRVEPDESMLDGIDLGEAPKVSLEEPEAVVEPPELSGMLAARISDTIQRLEERLTDKLERQEARLNQALARADRQSDQLTEMRRALGEAKSEIKGMHTAYAKAQRMMEEACTKTAAAHARAQKAAETLEKRLDIIVTPDKAVAPLMAGLKRTGKELEVLSVSVSRRFERLQEDLRNWVPEYRRKGRAPQG